MTHINPTLRFAILFVALCVAWTAGAERLRAQSLTGQQAADAQEKLYWIPRCENAEEGRMQDCEIFQRLLVKDTGQRVAEFAVGYPTGKANNARGVAVLPLGIMLNEKTGMRVDDGAIFYFQMRYCTQNGCYAFVDLKPSLIEDMKRGNDVSFYFTTLDGADMQIDLSLAGFTKALAGL